MGPLQWKSYEASSIRVVMQLVTFSKKAEAMEVYFPVYGTLTFFVFLCNYKISLRKVPMASSYHDVFVFPALLEVTHSVDKLTVN